MIKQIDVNDLKKELINSIEKIAPEKMPGIMVE